MSETIEKAYEIRPLKASDMGSICKIISGIGAKQFKDCFNISSIKKEDDVEKIGFSVLIDIASIIIENIPKAEKDILSFLSDITGMKVDDIKLMPLADYGELIIEVVTKDDFKDFFNRVMKLFNQ